MIIKTSELKGLALDYAVAVCEYPNLVYGETIGLHWASKQIVIPELKEPDCYYSPVNKWELAGQIIERAGITVGIGDWDLDATPCIQNYLATSYEQVINDDQHLGSYGETHLIAAMRCYVTSKMGESVDIPDELL